MFDALNALYLAATITSQALNIVGNAEADVLKQDGIKVYSVSLKQQAPMWVDKCLYDGVMVQYARDWEEPEQVTGVILPPEPDKPVGYALILTRENCPGKEPRNIFSTGSKFFYPLFGKDFVIRERHRIDAFDYADTREEMRPKWMPQVMKTIEAEAVGNPVAQAFVMEMQRRAEAAKIVHKDRSE